MTQAERPRVGIVVIGRNEGERLRKCLASIAGRGWPVVYADSASSDGSAAAASAMDAEVVVLDSSRPHTAARGRNAGYERLGERAAGAPEFVQFVDGDCEIDPGWVDAAVAALAEGPRRAIVTGRLREKHRDSSVYARLCDMEWQGPVGEIDACGGIFMIRSRAFREVGGFIEGIATGEEPDLCARLRQGGWTIARIDAEMGTHDAGMTRFAQWWRRTVRAGYFYAQSASRGSAGRSLAGLKRLAATSVWAAGVPALVVLAFLLLPRPWNVLGAAAGVALYGVLLVRVYGHRRRVGNAARDARLYSVFCLLAKWPELLGQIKYWLTTRSQAENSGAAHGKP